MRPPSSAAAPPVSAGAGRGAIQRSWVVVALGFVAFFASAPGQSFWISVFLDPMLAGAGLSRTAFTSLYAVATLASAATMSVVGALADAVGLRLIWLVASLGLAVACLMMGSARGLLTVLVPLSLLRIFGQGSLPLLGTLLIAARFGRFRGRAMSIATLGVTVAGLLLPPLVYLLISELGWRPTLRLTALALVVLLVPLALAVPRRIAHEQVAEATAAATSWRFAGRRFGWPNARAALLLGILAVPPLVSTAVVFHATSVLGTLGLDAGAAAAALSGFAAASVVGTLLCGLLADRVSVTVALAMMSMLFTVGVPLILVPVPSVALGGFVLLGAGSGCYFVLNGVVWAHTYGVGDLGRIQGLAASTQIAGAALGPIPLAISLNATGGYDTGLLVLFALALASLIGCAAVRAQGGGSSEGR